MSSRRPAAAVPQGPPPGDDTMSPNYISPVINFVYLGPKNELMESNRTQQVVNSNSVSPVKTKEEPGDSPFRIYKKGSDTRITESTSFEMKEKLKNSDSLYELSSDDEIEDELESNLDR